jgi:chromosome segregation ATPase
MLPDEEKLHGLELKIGLLNKDVEQTDRLCEKLSESIAKIQELNVNIMQMITLHEQRHEQHEKEETILKMDIKDLHDRINQVERHISERIDALRNDLLTKQNDKSRIPEILAEIEKYKWMILGGAIALGWVIGHMDLTMLGKLFK